ncbi:MAG: hypothetical protein WD342_01970 [Verrucomicrobiales bacterium]
MPEPDSPHSAAESRRVAELVSALRTEVEATISPDSPLMSETFVDEFQSRLLTQHVFIGTPLFQEGFDRAIIASAAAAGFDVAEAPGGQRFWDLSLNGRKVSLKSSKAKNLMPHKLHISKLTEAAWIQDCRTAAKRQRATLNLFETYCSEVDEILQLRYFARSATYELVGVPVRLLEQILDLPTSEFQADGPTINIPVGKTPPDFTLKIDRSDAKITLANILKANCIVHGAWVLPPPATP